VPAEGNGDLQTLICVLVVRPRQCPTYRILSPGKTEWRLISATLCGWRRCFVADQFWFMTCIREEEEVQIAYKEVYLYSALFVVSHTQGAQAWITQFYLQLHQCLPLPRKRSPDGASVDWGCGHLIAAYYSFIYPERMKGWVSLIGWPIADGLPTHISGHPSAAGQAQDRESSPVKDNVLPLCHLANYIDSIAWI